MADLGVHQQWLVSPDVEIEKKWLKVQIQERVSRINKTRQDIEDLILGQKVKLEAQVMMYLKEKDELERQLKALDIQDAELITGGDLNG